MGKTWTGIICITLSLALFLPLFLHRAMGGVIRDTQKEIEVYCHEEETVLNLELEDYIKGVVAGEMGPRAPLEALKAQAIAARTYALYMEGELCTDPARSQAYFSPRELRERWGFLNFVNYWTRISTAVKETQGIIMVNKGEPILAAYHANSGGATEASELVWGEPRPYLVSRDSSFERDLGESREDISFSRSTFLQRLRLPQDTDGLPEIIETSPSGRVLEMKIGDYYFSGREVRELLDLPSTLFKIRAHLDRIDFTVWGRGHGVGMSQDGASYLAEAGFSCFQILEYYYPKISFIGLY